MLLPKRMSSPSSLSDLFLASKVSHSPLPMVPNLRLTGLSQTRVWLLQNSLRCLWALKMGPGLGSLRGTFPCDS